ncbi:Conserved_hypothetical protein [Hexamita inflata]|uniref:Transmembrane protein n=1 Tax=Hexamita inflata TaxID=28002 RepID=A0AA86PNM1_9EUKA|nr:Conserved hypothetical protein [Hexamita inflata]
MINKVLLILIISALIPLSPVLLLVSLLVGIVYVTFFWPFSAIKVKSLVNHHIQKRKQLFLSAMPLYPQNQIVGKAYTINSLLFLFKPIMNLNIYIAISDGHLLILNKQLICINSKPLQYYFSANQYDQFCHYVKLEKKTLQIQEITLSVLPGHLNTPFIFNNKVVFSIFDFVFELNGLDLKFMCQIPNYRLKNSKSVLFFDMKCNLFVLNDKLLAHNSNSNLYQIKSNKFTRIKNLVNTFYFQFCDLVYSLDLNTLNYVNDKMQFEKIIDVCRTDVLFNSGGTLIINSAGQILVLNMMDKKVVQMDTNTDEIQQMIVTGKAGYQLRGDVLDTLFGPEFQHKMENYYENQMKKRYLCSSQTFQFIMESKCNQIYDFERAVYKLNTIKSEFERKEKEINHQMPNQFKQLDIITSSYLVMFTTEEQQ